jgi:hypothetical protein
VDPDEKYKYRDRNICMKRVEPDSKNYVSTFKTITRDQRIYLEDVVRLTYRLNNFQKMKLAVPGVGKYRPRFKITE